MRGFTAYHVHTAFGIESKVEEELQPGITISKPVSAVTEYSHALCVAGLLMLFTALGIASMVGGGASTRHHHPQTGKQIDNTAAVFCPVIVASAPVRDISLPYEVCFRSRTC